MNERDTWVENSSETPARGAPQGFRDMLSKAREVSRGQGVVQGSTIFFKNLAESVSHSNRNLKIGLSFLALTFVIITCMAGFMFVKAFRQQEDTKRTMAGTIAASSASLESKIGSLATKIDGLDAELQATQKKLQESETARATMAQEILTARQETQKVRQEIEGVQRGNTELYDWVAKFTVTYEKDRTAIAQRIPGLGVPQAAKQ
ncbi:MAG: hypothetical protein ABIT01_18180 [Thermoanaerobaculia bacterium]